MKQTRMWVRGGRRAGCQLHGKIRVILAAALAVVLLVVVIRFRNLPGDSESSPPATLVSGARTESRQQSPAVIRGLVSGESPLRKEDLTMLRARLLALSTDAAVAEIRAWLATGDDRSTGMEFDISGDNRISGWPTLRTFLIDFLMEIDTSAAVAASREILAKPTTADEWAIALRNVARGEPAQTVRDELRLKTEELIRNPEWQAEPSIGYLNAFDVLVHARAVESAPLLSDIVRNKDRRDLAHAGFLALDRLVQAEPARMLRAIAGDDALHASRPEMVAQQIARADLRDDEQRGLVKAWLLDASRTPLELEAFAESFPNYNQFISHNLLSISDPPSGENLSTHDAAAAAVLREWMTEAEFMQMRPLLERMTTRIAEFLPPES